MIKKTLILGTLMATAAPLAQAHNTPFRSGWLVGAHVGVAYLSGKFDTVWNGGTGNGNKPMSASTKKSAALGGLLGGYRHTFSNGWTIGGDVVVNFFNNRIEKNLLNDSVTGAQFNNVLKRNYSVVPGVNVGRIFNKNFHASFGLGLGISKFQLKSYNISGGIIKDASVTKLGFVPSIGFDIACTDRVTFSGNLGYEVYGKTNKIFGREIATGLPNASFSSNISPRSVTGRLGFVVKI